MENLYTKGHMRTASGIYINILDPKPEDFLIDDIAHALAQIPRFGGHMPEWYSVADHCVRCAVSAEPKGYSVYEALMHDASEAYLGDCISPLKKALPDYQKIEYRFMEVLASKFGFTWPTPPEIKELDVMALEYEWSILIGEIFPPKKSIEQGRRMFLNIYNAFKPTF